MTITRDVIAVDVEKLGTVHVPRLSAFMIDAIRKKANELYPLPDPKPYEQPLPDALIDGDVIPAAKNPEYQKVVAQVMLQRNRYHQYAALSAVELIDSTRADLVALYKDTIAAMRQYGAIPSDGDDFAVTLHYCILTPDEYIQVVNAATKEQALSQEEIRDNLRIFRRDVSGRAVNGNHRKEVAQDIPEDEQVQTQQPAG